MGLGVTATTGFARAGALRTDTFFLDATAFLVATFFVADFRDVFFFAGAFFPTFFRARAMPCSAAAPQIRPSARHQR